MYFLGAVGTSLSGLFQPRGREKDGEILQLRGHRVVNEQSLFPSLESLRINVLPPLIIQTVGRSGIQVTTLPLISSFPEGPGPLVQLLGPQGSGLDGLLEATSPVQSKTMIGLEPLQRDQRGVLPPSRTSPCLPVHPSDRIFVTSLNWRVAPNQYHVLENF